MSRACCPRCERPVVTCICHLFVPLENNIDVVILQHPKEVKHSKGSLKLLVNSLGKSTVIVGENFSDDEGLKAILADKSRLCCLLYPSEKSIKVSDFRQKIGIGEMSSDSYLSQSVSTNEQSINKLTLILIDATWKKAYRMFQLSKSLHDINHLSLPEGIEGKYLIRKTGKAGALSTLEAAVYALAELEQRAPFYQKLLESFAKFNQIQLSYRP